MSTPAWQERRSTTDAFDRHSACYAEIWGGDPSADVQRREVWRVAAALLTRGDRVLDAGCGAGLDARWLLDQGMRVRAIDASPGMVARTAQRAPEANPIALPVERAPELLREDPRPFDAAILDFGVINCLDPRAACAALAQVLRPGAPLLLVSMPRIAPAWMASALARGRWRRAADRLRAEVEIEVEGVPVRTRYWSAGALESAFSEHFALEDVASLGLLLPPPGSRVAPETLRRLAALEARVRRWPGLRTCGDHVLVVLRRRGAHAGRG